MQSYNIDFTTALPKNASLRKVPLASPMKGPIKPNTVFIFKDSNGRVCNHYEKPVTLNIANQTIKNVTDYNVINYRDAVTDKGKLYNITTPESKTSFYTHDGEFAHSWEHFNKKQTINMNGKPTNGYLIKEKFSDGSQRYEMITKSFSRKFMTFDPDGHVVTQPKKSLAVAMERVGQAVKDLPKLLKFPAKLGIINLIRK